MLLLCLRDALTVITHRNRNLILDLFSLEKNIFCSAVSTCIIDKITQYATQHYRVTLHPQDRCLNLKHYILLTGRHLILITYRLH